MADTENNKVEEVIKSLKNQSVSDTASANPALPEDFKLSIIPQQRNSESYNGAIKEKYSWSQNMTELDITVQLPFEVKSAKDLKVTINPNDICVMCRNGDIIIKDSLPYKIKAFESFWSISEGKLLIHLEKVKECWWDKFLADEEPIDLHKIDWSKRLHELPEEHIAQVRELQWNEEQKRKGLPTSDEIRNKEILKKP